MRGGKRKGAGRPTGTLKPTDRRILNTTIEPAQDDWLKAQKKEGHSKASMVRKALADLMAKFSG